MGLSLLNGLKDRAPSIRGPKDKGLNLWREVRTERTHNWNPGANGEMMKHKELEQLPCSSPMVALALKWSMMLTPYMSKEFKKSLEALLEINYYDLFKGIRGFKPEAQLGNTQSTLNKKEKLRILIVESAFLRRISLAFFFCLKFY